MALSKEIYSAFEDVVGPENICDDPVIMPSYYRDRISQLSFFRRTRSKFKR